MGLSASRERIAMEISCFIIKPATFFGKPVHSEFAVGCQRLFHHDEGGSFTPWRWCSPGAGAAVRKG